MDALSLLSSLPFGLGAGAAGLLLLDPADPVEGGPARGKGSPWILLPALLLAAGAFLLVPRLLLLLLGAPAFWGVRQGIRLHQAKRLTEEIGRELPVLADSLVLNVEAGLALFPSFLEAREVLSPSGALAREIERMEGDLRLGFAYPEILSRARERLGCPEADAFLGSISQALELGTPVARILREQSARMREHLLLEGERFANTLSLKLLLPLFLFIFPASFLLILAPVLISLLENRPW